VIAVSPSQCGTTSDLLVRIKSMTNIAAEITPAVPASAAVRSGKRSGVRPCKASKPPEHAMSESATSSGRLEAMLKIVVAAKYMRKCSFSQPSPVRGMNFVGSSVARTSETIAVAPSI
jgi:hypothetical protein